MKKLSLLMVLLFIVALTPIHAAKKVTITFGCFPDSWDQVMKKVLPEFCKKYPNFEVTPLPLELDYHNRLVTSIASGENIPDVARIEIGFLPMFMASGGFENLNQRPYKAKRFQKVIAGYKWEQATNEVGQLIAFPLDVAPGCAYWRRDLFAKAGVDIDRIETMQDLYEAAGKLTRDTDGGGKIDQWFTSDASTIALMIMRSSPNRLVYRDQDRFIWDSQRIRDAFAWARKFKQAGYCAGIGAWTNEWYKAFQNGTVAYEISGSWLGGHLSQWMAPKTAGLWGVARWPALNGDEAPMAGNWGGNFLGIPEKSQHKQEAWKLIQFVCTQKESQMTIYKEANSIPAFLPAWQDPYFDEKLDFFSGQPARRLWIEIAKEVPPVNTSKYDNVVHAMVNTALGSVLNEGKDIDCAIDVMKKSVEERIRSY